MNITIFPDRFGHTQQKHDITFSDLVQWCREPKEYPTKEACSLIKLATFGDVATSKGSLRHDANVLTVSGIEGDYDGGVFLSPDTAANLLTFAGIQGVVYTTPSHTPEKPRWRVLAPFSKEYSPKQRREFAARLNDALGGLLAPESFTLSQTYYFGRVAGTEYECYESEGQPIDLVEGITQIFPVKHPADGNQRQVNAETIADLRSALQHICADDYHEWVAVGQALKSLGDDGFNLWAKWSATSDKHKPEDLAKWAGFTATRTGFEAVFAKAQRNGWDNPKRVKPENVFGLNAGLNSVEMALSQLGNQDGVALMFEQRYAGKLLYDHSRGCWREWDGSRWKLERTDKAFDFARCISRELNVTGKSTMGSSSFCAGVENFCRSARAFSTTGEEFDMDNYLLNTPDGTYDLRTSKLRRHNPAARITLCTTVSPNPESGEVFNRFIDEITVNDRQLAEFIQVSLGACLSGAVESHWMLFFIGQGRNGKNTLGELIQDVLGDYARKIPASTLMSKKQESHPTEIANLQGIRLALASEINEGEYWNEARINEITGDKELSARVMRGDYFTFRRTHKHVIYGNHRPQLRAVATGIKSRIKIVPFTADFNGREDAALPARLRREMPYVLHWLMEGHKKWLEAGRKLPYCLAVEDESADYFASQSTVELWLSERVNILSNDDRPASQCPKSSELYADYVNWKKSRCETPVSQTRWAEPMRKFEKVTSNGARYRGLQLVSPFSQVA
ncbi:MAG: PriCT-2 domain-containing protein [Proteobacteria bacterium]|nr:PriCT-2 domain-containing protein [Pseudomonadota bacterium]